MVMGRKETEDMVFAVSYMQDLMVKTFSDASDAYEVLSSEHDKAIKYSLSLNYLSMSYQSFLEMRRVYHQYHLEHNEIEVFFSDYEDFKLQLKEVITHKDTNTSWLTSKYNNLVEKKKSVNEFITNFIKSTR
jgi:hypothetical protein